MMEDSVDVNVLNELVTMLGKDVINDVRSAFVKECQQKLPLIHQAWQAQDLSTLAELSHSLKSASSNLAMPPLCRAFAELEHIGAHGKVSDLPESLRPLDECYARSTLQLSALLK